MGSPAGLIFVPDQRIEGADQASPEGADLRLEPNLEPLGAGVENALSRGELLVDQHRNGARGRVRRFALRRLHRRVVTSADVDGEPRFADAPGNCGAQGGKPGRPLRRLAEDLADGIVENGRQSAGEVAQSLFIGKGRCGEPFGQRRPNSASACAESAAR